ncbi:MAG: DUF58 domain-containing protein [Verrucomicrobiales bacterium]|nr:DUF58 domain-containing protein [Verrucomicrobiales bacterium]
MREEDGKSESLKGSIDPATLMKVRSLELRARVVVEGFWKGLHRSPHHGFCVEFSEYRQYVQGDDPRFIDWKVMARSDRVYIKKFEDETNLRCFLLVDQSRSMSYAGGGSEATHSKSEYANTLAATLAYFLLAQGDAVGLVTFDEHLDHFVPARNRPGQLHRLLGQLELSRDQDGVGTDLIGPLKKVADLVRKRGLMMLISDLLAPIEDLELHLAYLAAAGHDLVVWQVLDRSELEFGFERASHFCDVESGNDVFIDPNLARESYLKKLQAHLDAVKGTCERNGIDYRLVATDEPLDQVLFDFVSMREKGAGKNVRRRNSAL